MMKYYKSKFRLERYKLAFFSLSGYAPYIIQLIVLQYKCHRRKRINTSLCFLSEKSMLGLLKISNKNMEDT